MRRKLYYCRTNAYDVVFCETESGSFYLTENKYFPWNATVKTALDFLRGIDDISVFEKLPEGETIEAIIKKHCSVVVTYEEIDRTK